LVLEAADLSPQLRPREALIAGDEKVGGLSLKELQHPGSSVDQSIGG
jgi:hypothetical protein